MTELEVAGAAADLRCGSWRGQPAFVVPQREGTTIAGLMVSLGFVALFALLTALADARGRAVGGIGLLFFGYLSAVNFRSLRGGAAWYLTEHELVVHDGAGTLTAAWDQIQGFTPLQTRAKTFIGLRAEIAPGSLSADGSARRWVPLNRSLKVPLLLRPQTHVGGRGLLEPLLTWCLAQEDRHLIGRPEGLIRFRAALGP